MNPIYFCVLCVLCVLFILAIVGIYCYPHIINKKHILDMNKNQYITDTQFSKIDNILQGEEIIYDTPKFEDYQWQLWDSENKAIMKIVVVGVISSVLYVSFLYAMISNIENF